MDGAVECVGQHVGRLIKCSFFRRFIGKAHDGFLSGKDGLLGPIGGGTGAAYFHLTDQEGLPAGVFDLKGGLGLLVALYFTNIDVGVVDSDVWIIVRIITGIVLIFQFGTKRWVKYGFERSFAAERTVGEAFCLDTVAQSAG